MSRFFAGGVSDSDYSSSEEELLSSSEEEEELNSSSEEGEEEAEESDDSEFANNDDDSDSDSDDGAATDPAYFLKKSFAKGAASDDESSDEEDGKKIVKSAKDKLLDEIRSAINTIDSSKTNNDWIVVLSEFDKLNRLLVRAQQQNLSTPNIYIKAIAQLDDSIQETQQDKKKLNASVSKAFNTVRQRVKKAVRDNSTLVESFRENPEAFEKEAPISATPSKAGTPAPGVSDGFTSVGKGGKSIEGASFFKTLRSVAESRGRKNVDVREQIKTLEGLIEEAQTPYQSIIAYLMLIPYRFDGSSTLSYMAIEQWKLAAQDINSLFKILEANKSQYRVLENAEALDDIEVEPTPNAQGIREILGSVVSFVERLDDEFTRSLQVIDPHATEYIDRLKDEQIIYSTIIRAQLYSELVIPEKDIANGDQIARVITRRIEHIYFKPSALIQQSERTAWESLSSIGQKSYILPFSEDESYIDTLLDSLASVLYKQTNAVYRKRAMLSHIYYYAFNNQYFKARDMFLISHLQSSIHTSDASLQILFNRALVQLGLCAFRNGLIQEAHQTLQEISTSSRHKELLGQGAQRFNNQNSVADKQRLLPFHTHINLELLESVFLTSSLLIEIPQYAQLGSSIDAKKRLQSKSFRRALEFHERQTFQGPPENTRDFIMHAAKALQAGNWQKASDLLNSIKIWNLFPESDKIRSLIKEKLQEEGLRTYVFQFKSFYSKLSIAKLSKIFELPESKVSAILSKMIFKEEIAAGLDQVSNSVVFTKGVELTKLQELALNLADRATLLSERNERLAGGHSQQQQGFSYSGYNSGNNQGQNHRQNNRNNQNFKFAPVTGALASAPGSISGGALNGMDKRNNQRRKTTRA